MTTLSSILADQINFLDEELTAEQLAEYAAARDALLGSLEQPHSEPTVLSFYAFWRKTSKGASPEHVNALENSAEFSLDDCLSRMMVSEIPKMVSRALQLEPILVHKNRQIDENPYLREATRCYLFGLFNASVALSRSGLEHALSKKVPSLLQGTSNKERLNTLIRMARSSVIKKMPKICDLAEEVRTTANLVIHGKMCQQPIALQVLSNTRIILQALY
jgi:hypothetical protein